MKVVFPKDLYDLIGSFAGCEKYRLVFTLSPKRKQFTKTIWIVLRRVHKVWRRFAPGMQNCWEIWRMKKGNWRSVTMETVAYKHCPLTDFSDIWNCFHGTSDEVYVNELKQFCKTVLTYRLIPEGTSKLVLDRP